MNVKNILQRLFSLAIGFVVAIFLMEIILRIWTPESLQYKAVRTADPVRHHRLEPSQEYVARTKEFTIHVNTNSLGLRDNEWNKDSNAYRIIVLGDSFVEGVGVEMADGIVQQLENRLNAHQNGSGAYEVLNFGIAGYSPILEYVFLKEKGIALKPDAVILCYDMTDVQEDYAYAEDAEFDSLGIPIRVHPSLPSFGREAHFPRSVLKTFVQEKSYLYTLVVDVISDPQERKNRIRAGDVTSGRYAHTIDSTAERWDKYFAQSEFYVKLIADLCRANNIAFVLSVHPRGHQLNEFEWNEGREREGLERGRVYRSAIFSSLEKFAKNNNIPFLNMADAFKSQSRGDLYYPLDGHWTVRGNQVAADTLHKFLIQQDIVNN